MNLSTAVFLINDNARAIMVTYEPHEGASQTMFKTFDKSIKVDDYVVVPTDTRHKLTVCKVAQVDVDVDFDCHTQVNWIIGRVDLADTNEIKSQEEKAVEAIKAAEKLKKKRELQNSMNELLKVSGGDLKLLSIGNDGSQPEENKVA